MYLQPSDAILRPDNAKFRGQDVDKILQKSQPLSGKLESTLDYMRDRGMIMAAVGEAGNVGGRLERSIIFKLLSAAG